MRARSSVARVLLAVALASALGCAGRGLRVQEYLLTPVSVLPEAQVAAASARQLAVGVGPVRVPSYLNRPQIVVRETDNQLGISDAHVWGENLEENISHVIAENLALMIPSEQVAAIRMNPIAEPDYRVMIQVQRFEREASGVVRLEAVWALARKRPRDVVFSRRSYVSQPVEGDGYPATVSAMSAAVATLSQEIAGAIRSEARLAAR